MNRVIKYLLILLASLTLLLLAAFSVTQMQFFRNFVRDKIINLSEQKLDAKLSIEQLNGNFYNSLEFVNVSLSKDDSTLLSFASLRIEYKLFPLIKRELALDTVILKEPGANIIQYADSTWNFNGLAKSTGKKKTDKKTLFTVYAGYFALQSGSANFRTLSNLIPESLTDLNIELNGNWNSGKSITSHLQNLNFQTLAPSLNVEHVSAYFSMDTLGISIDSLAVHTSHSKLKGDGGYYNFESLNAKMEADPLNEREFSLFMPAFRLACSPNIAVTLSSANDTTVASLSLRNKEQLIKVKIRLAYLLDRLGNKDISVPYIARVDFSNVIPEKWLRLPPTHCLINGDVSLSGADLLSLRSPVKVSANFGKSSFHGERIDQLKVNGYYAGDILSAAIELSAKNGKISADGEIKDIFRLPEYSVAIIADSITLTPFFPGIERSYINTEITASGRGFSGRDLLIDASIDINNSLLFNIPVNSGHIESILKENILDINSFDVNLPGASLAGWAELELKSLTLRSQVSALIDTLTFVKNYFQAPLSFRSFATSMEIYGTPGNLEFSGNAKTDGTVSPSFSADKLSALIGGQLTRDTVSASLFIEALSARTGPVGWDTITTEIELLNKNINAVINAVRKDTADLHVISSISLGDTIEIGLKQLDIKSAYTDYYIDGTVQKIHLWKEAVNFENLRLKDHLNPDFSLEITGTLAPEANNNFELSVNRFDIGQLQRLLSLPDTIDGVVSSKIKISGQSANPTAEATITVTDPRIGPVAMNRISGQFRLQDSMSELDLTVPDEVNEIRASIKAPMKISFDTTGFNFSRPETFEAELFCDSLNITRLYNNEIGDFGLSGNIRSHIRAEGRFDSPSFYGDVELSSAGINYPPAGINYEGIKANVTLDDRKVKIDSVILKQKAGQLSLFGEVEFDTSIVKGQITRSSIEVNADNFFVATHPDFELLIDGKAFLNSLTDNPSFGGDIKVLRSNIYLPALMSQETGKADDANVPLLLQALTDNKVYNSGEKVEIPKKASPEHKKSIFKNITGDLRVEIPYNTWLRNENMNLELNGDLNLVKSGPYFEIFGTLAISRGQYILYGKKLSIIEGALVFEGGEKVNPQLSLLTEYRYKGTDKVNHLLELRVSGKLEEPVISFALDGSQISETEAVSVLLFGDTGGEMLLTGQQGLASSVGAGVVAQMITTQLNKSFGNRLNLDMIEVTSTENWQSAALLVGKYITKNLFVSYQKGFGETEGEEITPETVTLEYKISRTFFLRLQSGSSKTSGLDMVLKLQKKD